MNKSPLVSVIMLTYNHEKYIAQAIESIYDQKVNFPIELIIANDSSTDKTHSIIDKLIPLAPKLISIKYLNHEKNLGIFKNSISAMNAADGQYIAVCEGDDFWNDSMKLTKQVEFLEENKECSMLFSNAKVVIENDGEKTNNDRGLKEFHKSKYFTGVELLSNWIVPTASIIFRKQYIEEVHYKKLINSHYLFADIILFLYLSKVGKVYGMRDYLVTYRRHLGGATNFNINIEFDIKAGRHYLQIIKEFGKEFKKPLAKHIGRVYLSIAYYSFRNKKYRDSLASLYNVLKYNPKFLFETIRSRMSKSSY